ncbi:hypothetical protein VOM14_14965 [Paraburkholderia sp. MPAMCS5]|uniref:hypothetical protein n=1 Tax=Paraburkholderia sp. MPAMCS5 TaxID=3112563 RepID=UPI002E181861|nr:hypothetical protein [Paraburkholderia sp. MPAMCS5]
MIEVNGGVMDDRTLNAFLHTGARARNARLRRGVPAWMAFALYVAALRPEPEPAAVEHHIDRRLTSANFAPVRNAAIPHRTGHFFPISALSISGVSSRKPRAQLSA